MVTDDRTDVDLLDELYQTALTDLTLARRLAIEASIDRLQEPLEECQQLIERINQFEPTTTQPTPIHNLTAELASTLTKIKNSTSVLGATRRTIDDLDTDLRESLGTVLTDRQLVVIDHTEPPPPLAATSDTVFRIAREAVNNAVLHGNADTITLTLSNNDGQLNCEIHDNGIGINPDQLHHRPGHLGTRAMQERARERGGTCTIEPDPNNGTRVRIWLPHHTDRPSLLHSAPAR